MSSGGPILPKKNIKTGGYLFPFRVLTPEIYFTNSKIRKQMKKFLLVLAVAGLAVACNNDSEKKATDKDTTTTVTGSDTITTVTTKDTTIKKPGDATIKKTTETDTSKKHN